MDPLSQAVLGAAAAQAVVGERLGRQAWWLGALGGLAPDLDVLLRSASDPLLALELHRHFTHSLVFIPIGGLLVAAPFLLRARKQPREHKWSILAATTVGWATHGLLDSFTSYGTLLFWPFSHQRVAWDWISVIDPLYTLLLAIGVVLAVKRGKAGPAWAGLLASSLYLGLCGFQHTRALAAQRNIAELRQHQIVRGRAEPLFFTNLLWRSFYESDDGYIWVDALTIPWRGKIIHQGAGLRRLVEAPSAGDDPRTRDLARFAWFADDWIYAAPELRPEVGSEVGPDDSSDEVYCDARYSLKPGGFDGVFCVLIGPEGATELLQRRPEDSNAALRDLLKMLRPSA